MNKLKIELSKIDLKEKIIFNSKELKYLEIEVSLIPTIKLVYLDN